MPLPYSAFTTRYNGLARELINEIGISIPFVVDINSKPSDQPEIKKFKALWDTGATNSAITLRAAQELNIKPVSVTNVFHAAGNSLQNVYLINIYLPNNIAIPNVRVTEVQSTVGNFDILIGMDIMSLGDLAISNFNGLTYFSFRLPSYNTIDFVHDYKKSQTIISDKTIGRNSPCHCGSGKKYKQCCGK